MEAGPALELVVLRALCSMQPHDLAAAGDDPSSRTRHAPASALARSMKSAAQSSPAAASGSSSSSSSAISSRRRLTSRAGELHGLHPSEKPWGKRQGRTRR
ncbi:hypothetical protein BRADI_4g05375v3 [Brachypodium distachyon]|uniref:Uncharacterized protein n=1 Tax=Brachypodium distachyon TaxID=15368 RepID=A0A0Q3EJ45_BRADI|nr:hypothetical protein BRADI_4g05375v3 [Brachypodium distachyon]